MAKPKYSTELKTSLAQAYLEGGSSYDDLAAQCGPVHHTMYTWVKRYQEQGELGFIQHPGSAKYTAQFKLKCLEAVIRGDGSGDDIVAKYDISDRRVLRDWIQRYNANKEQGLRSEKIWRTQEKRKRWKNVKRS